MKINIRKYILSFSVAVLMPFVSAVAEERILLLNEGLWQTDNGRLTYFEDGRIVSNQWFRDVNGMKLGDTPNDIIQVNDDLVAIALNWSNIVQFIDRDGKAVAATEDVPNNRRLATDGEYLYVTSYGHECGTVSGTKTFTKGFVAKIDLKSFKTVDAVEVGYEPEGIALYKGHLFVANTGGYAFQENHEYEKTVTVLDASTLARVRDIDTNQINLYGKLSQSGQYLIVGSQGDDYEIQPTTVILDCEAALSGKSDEECFEVLEYAATNTCTATDGRFYAVGSRFSFITGDYTFNYLSIDPGEVIATDGKRGVYEEMPGTVISDLKTMTMPYGIYVNPYTGYIYATDAGSFATAGTLWQWTPEGKFVDKYRVYINPAHFLALKPGSGNINPIGAEKKDDHIYDLHGNRVKVPESGELYIRGGKKFILTNRE
ncbi:MAG: hypothetical protein J6C81_05420 [Muribaculaceae bacterium]|nr:hypothetical protein [Muribaculaceae bacterium]